MEDYVTLSISTTDINLKFLQLNFKKSYPRLTFVIKTVSQKNKTPQIKTKPTQP